MKSSETELIFSLGVESGGVKFFRNQSSNGDLEFTYTVSSGGIELQEFEDTSSTSKPHVSGPFSTLDDAISRFSKNEEWVHFYPTFVHPEFGEQVWNLRASVLKRLEISDDSRHDKWFKMCHRPVKKRAAKELVLSLGFEGGGSDFYREVNPKGQVRFSQKSNNGGFDISDFVDDGASTPPTPKRRARTEKYASLELALAAEGLDGIWITAYPENVHPDFQNDVWDLRQRLLSESDPSRVEDAEHSDLMWARVCGKQ